MMIVCERRLREKSEKRNKREEGHKRNNKGIWRVKGKRGKQSQCE